MGNLVKCHACGKDVAKYAQKCPGCGAMTKGYSAIILISAGVAGLLIWHYWLRAFF